MLERTLVVVMGEFGRSPKVNAAAGRDHWNFCYSLLLAGGGIKAGYVHGASDKIGARPSRDPVTPADIIATIYHCLGIPADLELHDQLRPPPHGRPQRPADRGRPRLTAVACARRVSEGPVVSNSRVAPGVEGLTIRADRGRPFPGRPCRV